MEVIKNLNEGKLSIKLIGRLDSVTSPAVESQLDLNGVTKIEFDFAELDYISSAGLRLLLSCQKKLGNKEKVVVNHVKPEIMEIFELTGFDTILSVNR